MSAPEISVTDLFTPLTSAQIRQTMVSALILLGIPADQWSSGGVASSILTVAAAAIALTQSALLSVINGFFLSTATGKWLRALAWYVYGVTVPQATFASGQVTLTNSGNSTYTYGANQIVVQNTVTQVTYTITDSVSLGPGRSVTVDVQAMVSGTAGNANPTTISTLVTTMIGVSVTNALAVVGADAPTDPAIRQLCLNALGARSVRGPRTAYGYAVQTATNGGAPVNINRWITSSDSHTGIVDLYLASPSGVPTSDDVDAVITSVEANARPDGVTVNVIPATVTDYDDTITVYALAAIGVTSDAVQSAASSGVTNYLAAFPIGGVTAYDDINPTQGMTGLFASGVYAAIAQNIATGMTGVQILSMRGATDLPLEPYEVIANGTTLNVVLVSPTAGTVLA